VNTNVMVGIVQEVTVWLAAATDAVAVALIGLAVVEAIARTLTLVWRRRGGAPSPSPHDLTEDTRLRLARSLALALEFLLAADIMRTAVAPTWHEIGQLAAIAALRTALNFFIQREIDGAAARRNSETRASSRDLSRPDQPHVRTTP
jgi:uncharacterized membrane protein